MSRRRRRRSSFRWVVLFSVSLVVAAGYFMLADGSPKKNIVSTLSQPLVSPTIPLAGLNNDPSPISKNDSTHPKPSEDKKLEKTEHIAQGQKLFELAQKAQLAGDLVTARQQFSQAMRLGLATKEKNMAQNELNKLADEMIFSSKMVKGDSLVANYNVQSGDTLVKIAKKYQVTAELLARMNNIKDPRSIRAGQNLKVVQGPFHATISKQNHDMLIYLQDMTVRHYPVGLGEEGSTPTGEWIVKNKLTNPTYYPPRGGDIVAANDPQNPLGERWVGLEGVSGEAVGQQRYGIHGTNDPASIGKNMSLGCVRMTNADVEWVYDLLIDKVSKVTITE